MSSSLPKTMTRWNLFLYFSINLQMNVDFPDPLKPDTNKRAGLLKMSSTSSVTRPYDMTTKKGLNDNKVMHTLIYFIQKIHYIIKKPKTYLRNTKFIINLIAEIATFNLCFYIDSNLHHYSKDQNYYFNYKIQV